MKTTAEHYQRMSGRPRCNWQRRMFALGSRQPAVTEPVSL